MIRETELSLFVPSPELLVRLASAERPLGVRAGPPRIKSLRETFFDTPDRALRRRGMTCKLRQVEGEDPSVVVTVGEDPDSEGITSRSRLTAAAIGAGVFETLRGESEAAAQLQKFVDPGQLRPQIALDIQRLGRVFRGGLLLRPVLLLFFDRITVQVGGTSSVFHEVSVRRRRPGGPLIRDIGRQLKEEHHLFPDGLNRLQRAYRILSVEGKGPLEGLSPYGLNLALAVFKDGKLGLVRKGDEYHIPTFRGSGEDAARALTADLTGATDSPMIRLGTTEPREGRVVAELWTIPDPIFSQEGLARRTPLVWFPWNSLLEEVGRPELRDPTLVSTLLLLTRRKLLRQLSGALEAPGPEDDSGGKTPLGTREDSDLPPELLRLDELLPLVRTVEDCQNDLGPRLKAASRLASELDRVFFQDVTRTKGKILSGESEADDEALIRLLDLISIRVRGIVDRADRCLMEALFKELEAAGLKLRTWAGLTPAERVALLDRFSAECLPSLQIAPEWGPSFIPEMPMAGCAVGLLARTPGVAATRFFHAVLKKDPPSFLTLPGTTWVIPLEEAIKGYFLNQLPELEGAEVFMFRFMTGAATIRVRIPRPDPLMSVLEEDGEDAEDGSTAIPEGPEETASLPATPAGPEETSPLPEYLERRESVVVRVIVQQRMPESHQAQLLRALERQVSRRNPLIGWSDLFPVSGPLEWSGLDQLLDIGKEKSEGDG